MLLVIDVETMTGWPFRTPHSLGYARREQKFSTIRWGREAEIPVIGEFVGAITLIALRVFNCYGLNSFLINRWEKISSMRYGNRKHRLGYVPRPHSNVLMTRSLSMGRGLVTNCTA